MDITGASDPYINVSFLKTEHKTRIIKNTLSPDWNETFIATLDKHQVAVQQESAISLIVMDWDRLTKNDLIGTAEIGGEVISDMVAKVRCGEGASFEKDVTVGLVKKSGQPSIKGKDGQTSEIAVRLVVQRVGGAPEDGEAAMLGKESGAKGRWGAVKELAAQVSQDAPGGDNVSKAKDKKKKGDAFAKVVDKMMGESPGKRKKREQVRSDCYDASHGFPCMALRNICLPGCPFA